jgi:hypothetical protein
MPAKSESYNIDTLNSFCLQNELKILNTYEDIHVNRDTPIEGYCKTENCNKTYKKAFRMLNVFKNFYCHSCLAIIKNEKMKQTCLEKYGHVTNLLVEETKNKNHSPEALLKRMQTCLEKYGVDHPSKNKLVKQKMRESSYKKFGVEYASQNKEIKNKIIASNLNKLDEAKYKRKETNLKRYGEITPSKNEHVKQKTKNTNLQKYGFNSTLQNKDVKQKTKNTNLLKYGVEYPSQNQEVKNKVKQTCLKRFGVEYCLQSEEVKNKGKHTNIQKYGYECYQHNKIAAENAAKKAYKLKTFITPSGKSILCQGYEPFALEYLLYGINIKEKHIITSRNDVPDIWYIDENNKKHRHYVDIFIPTENLCIEVKSTWTIKQKNDNIFLKQNAAKELGYKYEIWVYDDLGNCIEQLS